MSGLADGAKAGAAFGPWGAAIGGAAGLAGDLASDPGANISGSSADVRSSFDGSGWTVSTGKARADGATITRSDDPFGSSPLQTAGGSPWLNLAMLGMVAVVALRFLRTSA